MEDRIASVSKHTELVDQIRLSLKSRAHKLLCPPSLWTCLVVCHLSCVGLRQPLPWTWDFLNYRHYNVVLHKRSSNHFTVTTMWCCTSAPPITLPSLQCGTTQALLQSLYRQYNVVLHKRSSNHFTVTTMWCYTSAPPITLPDFPKNHDK